MPHQQGQDPPAHRPYIAALQVPKKEPKRRPKQNPNNGGKITYSHNYRCLMRLAKKRTWCSNSGPIQIYACDTTNHTTTRKPRKIIVRQGSETNDIGGGHLNLDSLWIKLQSSFCTVPLDLGNSLGNSLSYPSNSTVGNGFTDFRDSTLNVLGRELSTDLQY
ncbi:hypothetical protein BGX23_007381 [Mortierella sp. AD031]|nr:hypothetical protein BGX23_007381 [Mortierella sp. AD031]KAG0212425.1 hypothetical protein BGX33_003644 [Mortierella sp. NVP41]